MTSIRRTFIFVLSLAVLAGSVQANFSPATPAHASDTNVCGSTTDRTIILESNRQVVGSVSTWNTTDNQLYLRVMLQDGWQMRASWLELKTWLKGLTVNSNGTFNYQAFPYQWTYNPPVSDDIYRLPMAWMTGSEMHIALRLDLVKLDANGAVTSEQTAWAYQKGYQRAAWTTWYFKHTIQTCQDLSTYQGCKNTFWVSSRNSSQWITLKPTDSFN